MTRHPRVIHVSDLHLGADTERSRERAARHAWDAFVERVAADPPDLIVATGDLVIDHPDNQADRDYAHHVLTAETGLPVRVVPGNHDVGDHALRGGLPRDWRGAVVTEQRVREWEAIWGPSHWAEELDGWTLVGLNAQLFASGIHAEAEQWHWLRRLSSSRHPRRPTAIFLHEPLLPPAPTKVADPWTSIPRSAYRDLLPLLDTMDVRLVAAGHTHRFHQRTVGHVQHITAPSLVAPIPERSDMLRPIGEKAPGWVDLTFSPGHVLVNHVMSQIHHLPRCRGSGP